MKTTFIPSVLFILLGAPVVLSGQTELSVISAAGRMDATPALQVEWTLGEMAVQTYQDGQTMYTEGFHQPVPAAVDHDPVEETVAVQDDRMADAAGIKIRCYPNPVTTTLMVERDQADAAALHFRMYGLTGTSLIKAQMASTASQMEMDLSGLTPGTYVLQITDATGHPVSAHQIIKL